MYVYISITELEITMIGVFGRLINQSSLNQIFAEFINSLTAHMLMFSSYTLLIINTIQKY